MFQRPVSWLLGACALLVACAPGQRLENTRVNFADVPLLDQAGHTVRLERDLMAHKIVVLGFVYSQCVGPCAQVPRVMTQMHQLLGPRVGKDVQLVSLSLDPWRDDPPRLAAYAAQYGSGPGWRWLTGTPQAVQATVQGLVGRPLGLDETLPLILVGDGDKPQWTGYYGLAEPAVLVREVEALSSLNRERRRTVIAETNSASAPLVKVFQVSCGEQAMLSEDCPH
ncbi:SCO family protein [Pseudomonas putida]